jgi:arylsulfatase A-like enzyme
MSGGTSALWKDEDMADEFVRRAIAFMGKNSARPFFLYFATHDIHVPRVPHPRFVGATDMGPRGDAIAQFDWCVGELLDTLDRLGLSENTLVILTSDNGPVVDDGYKYSAFEAGTREPFIVRWPGRIKPGLSGARFSQIDLFASLAALAGEALADDEAPDSLDRLDVLLGKATSGRDHVIEQARALSIVKGRYKYIQPNDGPRMSAPTNTELGNDPEPHLYDLEDDPGEKTNIASLHPDVVRELDDLLERIKAAGRTRPPGGRRP